MPRYEVELERVMYQNITLEVEGEDQGDAEAIAWEETEYDDWEDLYWERDNAYALLISPEDIDDTGGHELIEPETEPEVEPETAPEKEPDLGRN